MPFSISLLALTLSTCLFSLTDATGTLQLDLERRVVSSSSSPNLRRRSPAPISVDLENLNLFRYVANVTIGTPGQTFLLLVDTGSSLLWVPGPAPTVSICTNATVGCSFNSNASSTFHPIEDRLSIMYADYNAVDGEVFTDTLSIGGGIIPNFTMGLAVATMNLAKLFPGEELVTYLNFTHGFMGIGFDINEASFSNGSSYGSKYPNLIDAMVTAGLVSSKAYSLWLNDIASTGSILFGGIDTSKYSGDLVMLDILHTDNENFKPRGVALTSISINSSSGTDVLTNDQFPTKVILDSGCTMTFLPTNLVKLIREKFGVLEDGTVSCALGERSGTINFGFGGEGGAQIKIRLAELVVPRDFAGDGGPKFTSGIYEGQERCYFDIFPSLKHLEGLNILGQSFLRAAYVVFDLSNAQIAIAPAVFNSTAPPHIVPFASLGAPIPSARTIASQVTARTITSQVTVVTTATALCPV